jgi:hypothetical protein
MVEQPNDGLRLLGRNELSNPRIEMRAGLLCQSITTYSRHNNNAKTSGVRAVSSGLPRGKHTLSAAGS